MKANCCKLGSFKNKIRYIAFVYKYISILIRYNVLTIIQIQSKQYHIGKSIHIGSRNVETTLGLPRGEIKIEKKKEQNIVHFFKPRGKNLVEMITTFF